MPNCRGVHGDDLQLPEARPPNRVKRNDVPSGPQISVATAPSASQTYRGPGARAQRVTREIIMLSTTASRSWTWGRQGGANLAPALAPALLP